VLVAVLTCAWSTLRTNNTNREMANICITITCLLMLATPERDFCHGAVLLGVAVSVCWKLLKCQYPWVFGAWKDKVFYSSPDLHFSTGDVWLTTGTSTFSTRTKYFTNSNFSHVGLIVVDPPQEVLDAYHITDCMRDPRGVYVLESLGGFPPNITECAARKWLEEDDMRVDGIVMSSMLKVLIDFRTHLYGRKHCFARICGFGCECCYGEHKNAKGEDMDEVKTGEQYVNVVRHLSCDRQSDPIPEPHMVAKLKALDKELAALVSDKGMGALKSKEFLSIGRRREEVFRWTQAFTQFVIGHHRTAYEPSFIKLMGGVVRCNSGTLDEQGNQVEDAEAFCSEFVAAALQRLSKFESLTDAAGEQSSLPSNAENDQSVTPLNDEVCATNYMPADFEGNKFYHRFFSLCVTPILYQPPGMNTEVKMKLAQLTQDEDSAAPRDSWLLGDQRRVLFDPTIRTAAVQGERQFSNAGGAVAAFKNWRQEGKCTRCGEQMFQFDDASDNRYLKSMVRPPGGMGATELEEFRNLKNAVHATFECNVLRNNTTKEEEEAIAAV